MCTRTLGIRGFQHIVKVLYEPHFPVFLTLGYRVLDSTYARNIVDLYLDSLPMSFVKDYTLAL
jgi:hypothetical protein